MKRVVLGLLVAVIVGACGKGGGGGGGEQSYREGLEMFCEAPTKIEDGRNRLGEAIGGVVPKITNKQVVELLGRMGEVEGTDKVPMLRASVNVAGLKRCTVLEVWEEQVRNPPKRDGGDPLDQPVPPR